MTDLEEAHEELLAAIRGRSTVRLEESIQSAIVRGRIIPAVRMTRAGKWVKTDAQAYLANQEWLAWELKLQMTPMPKRVPLCLKALFARARLFHGDLSNIIKACEDAAQRAGIIANDAYIVKIDAEKHISVEGNDWTTISIWERKY